jgi:biopolymer transport protein TolR
VAANVSGSGEGDEEMISGINVTPLVDITLVLLIIFMVTASYIVKESIHVDLPRAAHAGESTSGTIAVVLTKEGDLYVDGVRRDEAGLRAQARAAVARDREARAVISADRASLHGRMVQAIDLLKGEGVSRFAIDIEKER